eukprot:CAMPEP_0174930276 /NCGR_PEP_ID=MMETSP1355-20121228/31061_1 /TAXON_ID=464990 /ORGANISM="Hemiselmis tepida, Strain CCMP443" /LENGTH=69 /DNA_ID=CAMNT_0016176559 /DNA_START=39 /DNA_END=248 /DNA_ORIENTATION=+
MVPPAAQPTSPIPVQGGYEDRVEEKAPSMVPLGTVVAMLGLMFIFVLAILGVVGDMHAKGVWRKDCPNV